jgi:hypothetical protein
MNKNIEELIKILKNTRVGLDHLKYNLNLLELEIEYQKIINKYSLAYLSGSSWYVGPSLIEYISNKQLSSELIYTLLFIAQKLNKKIEM